MLKLGNNIVSNLKLGSTQITKAYLGSTLVWQASQPQTLPYLDFNVNGEEFMSRYFDTQFSPTADTTIEWCFGINDNPALVTGWQNGVRSGWISGALFFNFQSNGLNGVWFFQNESDYLIPAGTYWQLTDKTITLRQEAGGKVYINGTQVYDFGEDYSPIDNSLFIGDVNENGQPKGETDSQGSGRLFWVKIYESGTLTHHYVPEIYNEQAGLYDIVENAHLESVTQTEMEADSIQYGEMTI